MSEGRASGPLEHVLQAGGHKGKTIGEVASSMRPTKARTYLRRLRGQAGKDDQDAIGAALEQGLIQPLQSSRTKAQRAGRPDPQKVAAQLVAEEAAGGGAAPIQVKGYSNRITDQPSATVGGKAGGHRSVSEAAASAGTDPREQAQAIHKEALADGITVVEVKPRRVIVKPWQTGHPLLTPGTRLYSDNPILRIIWNGKPCDQQEKVKLSADQTTPPDLVRDPYYAKVLAEAGFGRFVLVGPEGRGVATKIRRRRPDPEKVPEAQGERPGQRTAAPDDDELPEPLTDEDLDPGWQEPEDDEEGEGGMPAELTDDQLEAAG